MYKILDSFNEDLDNFHQLNLQLVELNKIKDKLSNLTDENKYEQITSIFNTKFH